MNEAVCSRTKYRNLAGSNSIVQDNIRESRSRSHFSCSTGCTDYSADALFVQNSIKLIQCLPHEPWSDVDLAAAKLDKLESVSFNTWSVPSSGIGI